MHYCWSCKAQRADPCQWDRYYNNIGPRFAVGVFWLVLGQFPGSAYLCCLRRDERRDFIRAKYEQHKYAIITCTDKEDLKQDLKQAVLAKDLLSLLQVYAEGLDLATTLPDMVRIGPQQSDVVSLSLVMALPCNYIVGFSLARTLN